VVSRVLTVRLDVCRLAAEPVEDFVFQPQTYSFLSPSGGIKDSTFNWDAAFLDDLEDVHRTGRRDPELIQRLGARMRVFADRSHWPMWERSVHDAVNDGRRVDVRIRSAARELFALPWELLTIQSMNEHIGALPNVLVCYEWPDTQTRPGTRSPGGGAGRVMLAYSGRVPAEDHVAALRDAWHAAELPFDHGQDVLADASLQSLDKRLVDATAAGDPVTVLHLLCHGTPVKSTFGLALDDGVSGSVVAVDAGRLRQVLGRHADTLRLVVLAACNSGNVGRPGNQMGSVAQELHRAGIEAVIASRYPLSSDGSIEFARVFYAEFAATARVDHAFLAARKRVANDARHLDWASLQLYTRAEGDSASQSHEMLSSVQALFRGTRERLRLLRDYKELHDTLQDLEKPFNVIASRGKRGLSPRIVKGELRDQLNSLQDLIQRILEKINRGQLREEFERCRNQLSEAVELLGAVLAGDAAKLLDVVNCIRHVLAREISSTNDKLFSTARSLLLDETIKELHAVCEQLRWSGDTTPPIEQLRWLVARLAELHAQLDALVQEHHRWQGIDNDLRVFVGTDRFDLDQARLRWKWVISDLVGLLQKFDDNGRRQLAIEAQQLELSFKQNDVGDCVARLRNLWRRCNLRFSDVDRELLATCQSLGGVGDTLDAVLSVIR
jgi:hypothetical protein